MILLFCVAIYAAGYWFCYRSIYTYFQCKYELIAKECMAGDHYFALCMSVVWPISLPVHFVVSVGSGFRGIERSYFKDRKLSRRIKYV